MQLPLQNIHNEKGDIYLFLRNPKTKKMEIKIDKGFNNYYYKESPTGDYYTYSGTRAYKVSQAMLPKDIRLMKGIFESDVPLTKKYIIEKDVEIIKSPLRYAFFDIEVLLSPSTSIKKGDAPISCISVWDSQKKKTKTFYLGDLNDEKKLLFEFIKYIKSLQVDMLCAWHVEFDWNYLSKRVPNIAELLSPISKSRWMGGQENSDAPAGISIVDYLQFFKKVYMREASYKLDDVCEKYLKHGKVHKEVDFFQLSDELKARNAEDVDLMAQLEDKFQLLPYYDEIRRLSRVNWEDLYHNSKAIEMICLLEAKKMKLALPNKKKHNVKGSFQGAIRDSEQGVFHKIGKYDLSGAYPAAIINFCLDETNISTKTDSDATNINGIYFKQNPNTLVPLVARKMVTLKESIGKELAKTPESNAKYSQIKNQYNGIKGVVNSTFGVLGNQYFRLYNENVVASITFLIRDLLTYVQDQLKAQGYKIIYHDTDSIFIANPDNVVDKMNDLIQEWGRLKYNKDEVKINFAYEGHFKDLLILGTCHYYGVKTDPKAKPEVKGIEMKRSSSTKFEAGFQESLIKRVLGDDNRAEVEKWIAKKHKDLRKANITDYAFPCKLSLDKEYKNTPVFVRALNNTKLFDPSFEIKGADKFFYIYIQRQGKDPNNKYIDVVAFKNEDDAILEHFEDKIDWKQVGKRNIDSKVERIFDALKWGKEPPKGLLECVDSGVSKKDDLKKQIDALF